MHGARSTTYSSDRDSKPGEDATSKYPHSGSRALGLIDESESRDETEKGSVMPSLAPLLLPESPKSDDPVRGGRCLLSNLRELIIDGNFMCRARSTGHGVAAGMLKYGG